MKKEYIAPALETIKFDISDIITHSNANFGGGDDGVVNPPRRDRLYMTKRGDVIIN